MNQPLPNASFQRRLGAMFYDGLLLFALLFVAATPLVLIAGGADSPLIKGPFFKLYLYGICFIFFGWFWTRGGQTLGMRSWKVRVMRFDGEPLGWDSALIRYILATVSILPIALLFLLPLLIKTDDVDLIVKSLTILATLGITGYLWGWWSNKQLTFHDRFSKTRVVFDPAYGNKQKVSEE